MTDRSTLFLLLTILLTTSLFLSVDAQVTTCKVCTADNDSDSCAKADNVRSDDCNESDHANEYCFVERDAGNWKRVAAKVPTIVWMITMSTRMGQLMIRFTAILATATLWTPHSVPVQL
eukprot:TRINITY_DN37289_c0_g1_i1.p1 TRINITY_DN37289_c0_g1~~TRINITY_DN37289_c0_g1_i1.p1  ORF type:complete len:119 (-),score=3.60 TRINITY_DN37289_c0_g1_i1:44-400(-)